MQATSQGGAVITKRGSRQEKGEKEGMGIKKRVKEGVVIMKRKGEMGTKRRGRVGVRNWCRVGKGRRTTWGVMEMDGSVINVDQSDFL